MELTEIEAYADQLLETLKGAESAAEVRDLVFRLDGLYRGAQIKAAALATGPCMDQAPTIHPAPIVRCVLMSGHAGGHSDGSGMSWTGPPAPTCGFKWKWGQGREQHYEVCTLGAGHGGTHHLNQMTGINKRKQDCSCVWATRQAMSESNTLAGSHHDDTCALYLRNFAEPPVKPVADRLHELVSYCNEAADGLRAEAGRHHDGSVGDVANRREAKGYHDVATKLEALLMEGGI